GGARERQCAGEQLVEGHAEGVDVAAVVGLATVDLFGGDIGEGGGELARGGEVRVVVAAGDAEVGDEDVVAAVAVFGDQQIGRLDVAVQQAAPVGGVESGGGLGEDADRPPRRHAATDQVRHVRPVHIAHGDPQQLALDAAVVDLHHVRMVQAHGHLGF